MSETTNNMNVGSQIEVGPIKPVHRKTIEGSTPGDFRSKAAPAVLPDNPGPREPRGQSKVMSSRLAASDKTEQERA
jgi:hypothetical protein